MTLTDDEVTDLHIAYRFGTWDELLGHVSRLCADYHAQGLVMGDLGHDGTVQWEVDAQ